MALLLLVVGERLKFNHGVFMLEAVGCWDAAGDGNNYDKAKGKKKIQTHK